MKKRFYGLPFKAAAIILLVLIGVGTLFCGTTGGWMYLKGYYSQSSEQICRAGYRELLLRQNQWVYLQYNQETSGAAQELSVNYCYRLLNGEGELLQEKYPAEAEIMLWQESEFWSPSEGVLRVEGALRADLLAERGDPFVRVRDRTLFFYRMRLLFPLLAVLGALTMVVIVIYLFCSVANHPGEERPRLNPVDHFPFDIATLLLVGLALLEVNTVYHLSGLEVPVFLFFVGVLDFLLMLWYFLSLAARLKVGRFWQTTLVGALARWLRRTAQKTAGVVGELPLVRKTVLVVAVLSATEFFVLLATGAPASLFFWWAAEKLVTVPAALYLAVSLRRLQQGGERLAAGNLEEKLDPARLVGDFRQYACTLNSIGEGMNRAVEERLRSERFKTELITNVSHDIKTPLTSIINYVDLLKKEDTENPRAAEYLAVLDRQSARLKKLIEDLLEASKASTGNLQTHPERCDLEVLLMQMVGEYDARFRAARLEPVVHCCGAVWIEADPRHLWRILDNLLTNAVKYAQPDTRLYLDLTEEGEGATVIFRNISGAPLNISGEELMERFVRGDRSRSTEGSGLGLSIARSLTELQGGALRLEVDGDLFKVILSFPRLPLDESQEI